MKVNKVPQTIKANTTTHQYKEPTHKQIQPENPNIKSPDFVEQNVPTPQYIEQKIPAPPVGLSQNQIIIDGVLLQIKSTKVKYHRAKVTDFYKVLKQAPLSEILSLDEDFFGAHSPDKMLFDWLVAVIDDPDFVTQHYNNFTAKDVDDLVKIYCRLNGIDQREERKNRQAQVATTRH